MASPQLQPPSAATSSLPKHHEDDDDDNEGYIKPQPSGFERIDEETEFTKLTNLLKSIQDTFEFTTNGGSNASNNNDNNNGGVVFTNSNGNSDANEKRLTLFEKDVKHVLKNVVYIRKNLNGLKTCPNKIRAEEQLQHLMDAADNQTDVDFDKNSDNLRHLLQIVSKLKHWVPPQRTVDLEEAKDEKEKNNRKKKESPIVGKKDKDNAAAEVVKTLVSYDCENWGLDGLLKSYDELEVRDKLCLLCFSVFPCDVEKIQKTGVLVQKNLMINKKILIYWWVGEGLIDVPPPEVNSDPPCSNSTSDSSAIATNSHETLDPQAPISTPNTTYKIEGKTIEEIGENILKVLKEKGFIEPVMKRGRESGSYQMHPFVHSFVAALAKRAGFFDFSKEDGKLIPSFTLSQRACLLKSQGKIPSSCKIWKEQIDNRNKLKKFATVQTLFNVNDAVIDIKPEWFSKMKYLSVLHLGSWRSETAEHIEVEDQKFLEDLKGMKQLKLFSLQGLSTIMKLPDSVCKLTNLIILDLRECHNLEELPADIGSLKNLTHLDITNCHLVTKLPKGISLLSKLEVLNGFVIYNQDGDCEDQKPCILVHWWKKTKGFVVHDLFRCKNKELCTLRDLLKLGNLRELSIVVNRENFPTQDEVDVFMKMRKLSSLKISWENNYKDVTSNQNTACQGVSNQTATSEGVIVQTTASQGDSSQTATSQGDIRQAATSQGDSVQTVTGQGDVGQTATNQGDSHPPEEPQRTYGCCFTQKQAERGEGTRDVNIQLSRKDTKRKSAEGSLGQILKLELWCYPGKMPPNWMVPRKLKNLKKLYIKGGKLTSLDVDENNWNVEILRLKYLKELQIEWRKLIAMFPKMTYLEKYECNKLGLFPCDHQGVWQSKGKSKYCLKDH